MKNLSEIEFSKLRALRALVLYVPLRLCTLGTLIFMRLNYVPCAPYLLFARPTHSRYNSSQVVSIFSELIILMDMCLLLLRLSSLLLLSIHFNLA